MIYNFLNVFIINLNFHKFIIIYINFKECKHKKFKLLEKQINLIKEM
jgi:hypothetical protein